MEHIRRILACLLLPLGLLVWPAIGTAAQEATAVTSEYAFRHYTTLDGLPQMLTECIYQDKKGYIWIGTLAGFVRYDGFEFVPYLKGGRPENIVGFHEDARGVTALGFRRKHLAGKTGRRTPVRWTTGDCC